MNNLFGPGCPWYDWFETFGPANLKWCEQTVCGWANEPANTWSNLAYFFVAFFIYKKTGLKKYALTVLSLGMGSLFYHASNNYLSQIFDFLGMYIWGCYILTFNLLRLKWVAEKEKNFWYAGLILFFTLLIPLCRWIHFPYQYLVIILGVFVIGTEIRLSKVELFKKDYRPLFLTLGFIAVAECFSLLDLKRVVCDPENHYFQGHALWHIVNSIGIYFSAFFYKQVFAAREN